MQTRRQFMKLAATAGAGAALYKSFWSGKAWAFAQSPTNIRKLITTLPGLGPAGANNLGQYPFPGNQNHTDVRRETDRCL